MGGGPNSIVPKSYDFPEESKGPAAGSGGLDLLDAQFDILDKANFESFDFGAMDVNDSMRVDMDDYSIIMLSKKNQKQAQG